MKSTQFFLQKAKSYVDEINTIISDYHECDINNLFSIDTPYAIQQKSISQLKLKINLLFSEFDKGEFFLNEIKKVDSSILNWGRNEEENFKSYQSLLELFIDHINQYRN